MENAPLACTADREGLSASQHTCSKEDLEITALAEKGQDTGRLAIGGRRTPKGKGRILGLSDPHADRPWSTPREPGK